MNESSGKFRITTNLTIVLSSFLTVKSCEFLLGFFLWSFIPQPVCLTPLQYVQCTTLGISDCFRQLVGGDCQQDFWSYPNQSQRKSIRMILSAGKLYPCCEQLLSVSQVIQQQQTQYKIALIMKMSEALRLNFSYPQHLFILNIEISHNIIKELLQVCNY